jgi:hypothetical protein
MLNLQSLNNSDDDLPARVLEDPTPPVTPPFRLKMGILLSKALGRAIYLLYVVN